MQLEQNILTIERGGGGRRKTEQNLNKNEINQNIVEKWQAD
jgi:hypothetical protein